MAGVKFDSSYDRAEPFVFEIGLDKVLDDWDEGGAGMKEGGKRKLIVPLALGYGDQDVKDLSGKVIPANFNLLFEIELLEIEP